MARVLGAVVEMTLRSMKDEDEDEDRDEDEGPAATLRSKDEVEAKSDIAARF